MQFITTIYCNIFKGFQLLTGLIGTCSSYSKQQIRVGDKCNDSFALICSDNLFTSCFSIYRLKRRNAFISSMNEQEIEALQVKRIIKCISRQQPTLKTRAKFKVGGTPLTLTIILFQKSFSLPLFLFPLPSPKDELPVSKLGYRYHLESLCIKLVSELSVAAAARLVDWWVCVV